MHNSYYSVNSVLTASSVIHAIEKTTHFIYFTCQRCSGLFELWFEKGSKIVQLTHKLDPCEIILNTRQVFVQFLGIRYWEPHWVWILINCSFICSLIRVKKEFNENAGSFEQFLGPIDDEEGTSVFFLKLLIKQWFPTSTSGITSAPWTFFKYPVRNQICQQLYIKVDLNFKKW